MKNAFLHLEEKVHTEIPPKFVDDKTQKKVYRLKKVLDRMKQSPRAWFNRFSRVIIFFSYQQSNVDYILFFKYLEDKVTLLTVLLIT